MANSLKSRISKLNQLKLKFRLDNLKLLTYIDSGIHLHELELVLSSSDSIYLSLENVEAIEKGMAKAQTENTGKVKDKTQNSSARIK